MNGPAMIGAPKRIQLQRRVGWRIPLNTVKVDRTTPFGNPWRIGQRVDMKQAKRWGWAISPAGQKIVCEDACDAVRRFTHALQWDAAIHDHVRKKLGGRDLACWCAAGAPCHADALLIVANSTPDQIRDFHAAADRRLMEHAAEVLRP